jgi:hypothetical protein
MEEAPFRGGPPATEQASVPGRSRAALDWAGEPMPADRNVRATQAAGPLRLAALAQGRLSTVRDDSRSESFRFARDDNRIGAAYGTAKAVPSRPLRMPTIKGHEFGMAEAMRSRSAQHNENRGRERPRLTGKAADRSVRATPVTENPGQTGRNGVSRC